MPRNKNKRSEKVSQESEKNKEKPPKEEAPKEVIKDKKLLRQIEKSEEEDKSMQKIKIKRDEENKKRNKKQKKQEKSKVADVKEKTVSAGRDRKYSKGDGTERTSTVERGVKQTSVLVNQNEPGNVVENWEENTGGFDVNYSSKQASSKIEYSTPPEKSNRQYQNDSHDPWNSDQPSWREEKKSEKPNQDRRNNQSGNYRNTYHVDRFGTNDGEFQQFKNLLLKDQIDGKKIIMKIGDLFSAPEEFSLAHCVAEDMSMGAGIAMEFRRRFRRVSELLNQNKRTGDVAVLKYNDRYIYYLVTKERSSWKPTLYTLWKSLIEMRKHIEENEVTKLAMPEIGCGLDRLIWSEVKLMLEYIFKDFNVDIIIYSLYDVSSRTKRNLSQFREDSDPFRLDDKSNRKGTQKRLERKLYEKPKSRSKSHKRKRDQKEKRSKRSRSR